MKKTVAKGKVFFVGAGPGDPGLITLRGLHLIQDADVIVVDALVNPSLLRWNFNARVINVGKRGPGAPEGASERLPQTKINALLVKLARQNFRVVRLKGGDPFVFGRGGEEVEAVRRAGIEFEIVPGITSAIAAPAYAGIPVSDRRWASQVVFLTGQEGKDGAGVDWTALPPRGTLVILMGVHQWPSIQKRLLQAGWSARKPVSAIESGTTARQRVINSTLGASIRDFHRQKLVSPTVIVVGDVAALSNKLDWIGQAKPLLDRKIVVTRPFHQSAGFARALEEKGADVISCPALQTIPLTQNPEVQTALQQKYDWILFLSVNGVASFRALLPPGFKPRGGVKIGAVGPATASALQQAGWRVHKTARVFDAQGVIAMVGSVKGRRLLIPRVQNGPPDLNSKLKKKGALVTELATYETRPAPPPPLPLKKAILAGVDAVTFTSARTVNSFLAFFTKAERKKLFKKSIPVSIGPSTTAALRGCGIKKVLQAKQATSDGMVKVLCEKF